jgi:hypothetical protein
MPESLLDIAPFANSIAILVIGSFGTFATTWYWTQRSASAKARVRIADASQKAVERISELENKLAVVTAAVVPISTAFQAILIKELTHSHTPELDDLLAKIGPPNVLSAIEDARMRVLLKERTVDQGPLISAAERDAAIMLPLVMARAKAEQAAKQGDILMVSLPPGEGESTDQTGIPVMAHG